MSERWDEIDDVDLLQIEAEMHGDLQELREAATVYADRAWKRGAGLTPQGTHANAVGRRGWIAWVAAGVSAAVLAVGATRLAHRPAGQEMPGTRDAAVQVRAVSPVSDEALLQQIQSDLSSGVPAAMEPLQASSTARGAQDAVKR